MSEQCSPFASCGVNEWYDRYMESGNDQYISSGNDQLHVYAKCRTVWKNRNHDRYNCSCSETNCESYGSFLPKRCSACASIEVDRWHFWNMESRSDQHVERGNDYIY